AQRRPALDLSGTHRRGTEEDQQECADQLGEIRAEDLVHGEPLGCGWCHLASLTPEDERVSRSRLADLRDVLQILHQRRQCLLGEVDTKRAILVTGLEPAHPARTLPIAKIPFITLR